MTGRDAVAKKSPLGQNFSALEWDCSRPPNSTPFGSRHFLATDLRT
ncbi:hypothetical protein FRUB_04671 [Fimbriiglobus ruber]|uniref:Uncharacterized protein n=1 Tax=Fimbriiglobus ruber TaxID=1908690 RepID=A0A225DUE4_9BACT|nr:hypothetical protein FRUB_04671 [Fimbriiglobus ruber]